MMRAALLLLFVGLNCCLSVSAAGIDDLLAKVSIAYGGEAARQGAKGMRQKGVTYSNMRKMEGRILRAYQAPDRLRIEIRYPDAEEIRILNGPHAWKQEQPMTGPFHGALVLQAARLALPWNLLEARDRLRDLGTKKFGDTQELHVLELPLGSGLVMEVGIEPESGRITRSLGKVAGSMGVMEFGTAYEDFRTQDGRLYAATEQHFAIGQPTGTTRIDHVEFLEALPESLFTPPGPESKSLQHI